MICDAEKNINEKKISIYIFTALLGVHEIQ